MCGNLKKQYTEKAMLSDYISSSNTDLENDLDGLKISLSHIFYDNIFEASLWTKNKLIKEYNESVVW